MTRPTPQDRDAERAVEQVVRLSYGRLVAILAARSGDIAGAEDALSEAFQRALSKWPADGVPDNPDAWLVTTARRLTVDDARRRSTIRAHEHQLQTLEAERLSGSASAEPDPRLSLMFACSHPSIDQKARAPLVLQTVLGIDAKRMAPVFLVSPNALGQRLARAKNKIRRTGLSFQLPGPEDWRERVDSLLNAIYAAYSLGWDAEFTNDDKLRSLCHEALWLARVLHEFLPDDPEVSGLLALVLFCHARRRARRDPSSGAFIPLANQDTDRWDEQALEHAENLLRRAGKMRQPGRFQVEAAIQAVHADRRRSGRIDWPQIAAFHQVLHASLRTVGSAVALAAATLQIGNAETARQLLDDVSASHDISDYQPYWATRAHVLSELNDPDAAKSWSRAAALSTDPAVRSFLRAKAAAFSDLSKPGDSRT